jgi:hypothetical protein
VAQGVFLLDAFTEDFNLRLDERLLNRRARWGGFAVFVFLVMERVFCSAGQSSSV